MWLIRIICLCLPFLFVFFLLPFFRLTFSSISSSVSYLPEYGPAPFPGRRSYEVTKPGFSLFVLMFAVFLVKDACLFFVPVGLACDAIVVSPVVI